MDDWAKGAIGGVKRTWVKAKTVHFPRFLQYLRDGIIPHPHDISTKGWIRPFAKWYFDFVKNAIAVGALMAIAKKTHSVPIFAIALFSFATLGTYVMSYIQSWRFDPFHGFANSRLAFHAGVIFSVLTTCVFFFGVQYVLITAIYATIDSNTK